MTSAPHRLDPDLDLAVEREVRASARTLWAAWTDPEQLRQWYAPPPTVVEACDIDPRPGGRFGFVLRTDDGQSHPYDFCYLVVEPLERLVWTDAVHPGFRPTVAPWLTVSMTLEPIDGLTRCRTVAMHRDRASRDDHERQGFHDGWGTVLDQLATFAVTRSTGGPHHA